jgi:hypothetical protein
MHADEDKINQITQAVIGAAFRVGNTLGYGFLEKVPLCLLINFGKRVDIKRFANFRPA